MRRWVAAGLALAAAGMLAGCKAPVADSGANAEVEDAWVRLPAVPGRPAAGYFHIRTDVGSATLVGVDSPQATRAEMHESMAKGAMTTMRPLARVVIDADSADTFEPGGRHVMLFGLAPTVQAGGSMTLRLHFANDPAPSVVEAKVVGPADPAP